MRYDATLQAYDCLDQVVVAATVRLTDVKAGVHNRPVFLIGTTVRGEGLEDPRQWLQEALLALVERI